MKRLTDELDHKVLLRCRTEAAGGRRRGDRDGRGQRQAPLRLSQDRLRTAADPNTTVEMLAQYLAGRVCRAHDGARRGPDGDRGRGGGELRPGRHLPRGAPGDPRAALVRGLARRQRHVLPSPPSCRGGGYQRPSHPAVREALQIRSARPRHPPRAPRSDGTSIRHEVKVRDRAPSLTRAGRARAARHPARQPRVSARAASHDWRARNRNDRAFPPRK